MAPYDSLEELLHDLEKRLQRPDIRHSPDELDALLADEFVEFGSSGRVYDKQGIINELAEESPIRVSMTDADDLVLVTYRAAYSEGEDETIHHSFRSSIWKHIEGSWQMVFHQGTPTSDR
jgi:hypothetical protein